MSASNCLRAIDASHFACASLFSRNPPKRSPLVDPQKKLYRQVDVKKPRSNLRQKKARSLGICQTTGLDSRHEVHAIMVSHIREGKVPMCREANDCLHVLPGSLYHCHPKVWTGYCRRYARRVTSRTSIDKRRKNSTMDRDQKEKMASPALQEQLIFHTFLRKK